MSQLNTNSTGSFSLIDETSRAQLIDDAYNLGRAEFQEQTLFLRLVSYLRANNETDSKPYLVSLKGLNFISSMLASNSNETIRKFYGNFFQSLYRKPYARLNWKNITDDISDM